MDKKKGKRQEEFSGELGNYMPAVEKEQLAKGLKKLFKPKKQDEENNNTSKAAKKKDKK